jgi:hypothetical protein
MSGPCNTNGGEEERILIIGGKARRKETTRKNQDAGGWIILGWILERWDGVMLTGLVWFGIGTGGELL